MNNLTFTLVKETTINVNIDRFVEKINRLYDYYEEWGPKCKTWTTKISTIIEEMTLQDTFEYDNCYSVIRQILIHAIICSNAKNDSKSVRVLHV